MVGWSGEVAVAPLTMTVPAGVSAATSRVSVTDRLPLAGTVPRPHVTTLLATVQPTGLLDTKDRCGSSGSVTTTAVASDGPLLVTVMV